MKTTMDPSIHCQPSFFSALTRDIDSKSTRTAWQPHKPQRFLIKRHKKRTSLCAPIYSLDSLALGHRIMFLAKHFTFLKVECFLIIFHCRKMSQVELFNMMMREGRLEERRTSAVAVNATVTEVVKPIAPCTREISTSGGDWIGSRPRVRIWQRTGMFLRHPFLAPQPSTSTDLQALDEKVKVPMPQGREICQTPLYIHAGYSYLSLSSCLHPSMLVYIS
jgi:hypothetical protein